MLKHFLHLSTAAAALACVGCGESATSSYNATVQGAVTIDGDLAPGGTVTFTPVKKGPVAVGPIAADGSYSLRIGQGTSSDPDHNKIPSGEYVATVEINGPPGETAPENEGGPQPAGPRLMADKYASKETSELTEEVTEGLNIIDLKLEGTWANPPDETEEDATDDESDDATSSDDADSADTATDAESEPPPTPAADEPTPTEDKKEEQQ